jgi:hypothetical protein
MKNVFISHPTPFNKSQKKFLDLFENRLREYDLNPMNLGKKNWDFRSPLKPINEIMNDCCAAVIIGMERHHSLIGYEKEGSEHSKEFIHKYTSSPWIQIEAGMAYQAKLPLLILKEKRIYPEGILDPLASEYFVFEFDIEKLQKKLSEELEQIILSWVITFHSNYMVNVHG